MALIFLVSGRTEDRRWETGDRRRKSDVRSWISDVGCPKLDENGERGRLWHELKDGPYVSKSLRLFDNFPVRQFHSSTKSYLNTMTKSTKKNTAWQKTRKFFNDIHLWTGLISGIIIVAVCLSGTMYTYNTELREWAAPHLHRVEKPANSTRLPADLIIEKVSKAAGGRVSAISIPHDPYRTYQLTVRSKGDKSRFGTSYYVNPYNGEITGDSNEKSAVGEWMGYMFSLHRWLLLDKIEEPIIGDLPNRTLGSYLTGTATILFTLGVLTGMVIWVPKRVKNWKQGLRIKWGGSWKRTNHDLHNTLAFYSLIILFLMGITGPQWSFPWYRTALQKSLGTYKEAPTLTMAAEDQKASVPKLEQATPGPANLLPIETYLEEADLVLPYPGDYRVSLPENAGKPVEISKNRVGFFAPAAGDKVSLNASTSAIISTDIFREKPFNERIAGSIKALHLGNIYGQFSKLLYFMACLIATSLPVTGTLIWLNKMKKKTSKNARTIKGKSVVT